MTPWNPIEIGDLIRIKHGFAFKGEHFSDVGKFLVLTPGNFHEGGGFRSRPGKDRYYKAQFPETYILAKGDLIVAMTEQGEGLLGSPAIIPKPNYFLHNQRLGLVSPKEGKSDSVFLYHLFNTEYVRKQIRNTSSGAKVRHTSPERIYRVKVRVPDYSIRKKIAAVLSAYDDLIENNKRRIAILEKMAEEIYREWFVRLRFPGYEAAKFEKGLPVSWNIEKADSAFDVIKGKSYNSSEISDVSGDRPFVTLKSFNRGGGYRNDGIKFYSGKYNEKQLVSQNDIVIAVTDMTQNREVVGRAARIPNLGDTKAVISLDAVKIVPKNIPSLFLYCHLRWSGFGQLLKDFANGANVLHLSPGVIPQQKLLIPDSGLMELYDQLIAPIFAQVDSLFDATSILTRTRQILLPRLISGRLSVEDLDIQFPASMIEEEQNEP